MTEDIIYRRHIENCLLERLSVWPAALLLGPRQSGKTTLARKVLEPQGYGYINFEHKNLRESVASDPNGFIASLPDHVIFDEVQHALEIILPLKAKIDADRKRGKYLLTGSWELVRQMPDSLAGRAERLRLHLLSCCERAGTTPRFLDDLFRADFKYGTYRMLGDELHQVIALGGYPVLQPSIPHGIRQGWLMSHISNIMERDLSEMYRVGHPEVPRKLLSAAAAQTARLLNVNRLASTFEATRPTVKQYLELLQRMFLLETLPAWSNNRLNRVVKTPKLHMGDTGLACAMLSVNAEELSVNRDLLGQLTETFVYQELRRQASGRDIDLSFYHYRGKDKTEVDIVIEGEGMKVAGVEVKAGATVFASDFRGLGRLAEAAGSNFACGVVLYDGETCIGFGERLFAVPIRRLWESI